MARIPVKRRRIRFWPWMLGLLLLVGISWMAVVFASALALSEEGGAEPLEAPADTFRAETPLVLDAIRLAATPEALIDDQESLLESSPASVFLHTAAEVSYEYELSYE